MTTPDTLKDTCPHWVQCATFEECDSKEFEPKGAAALGERLILGAEVETLDPTVMSEEVGAAPIPSAQLVSVVRSDDGRRWNYRASFHQSGVVTRLAGQADSRWEAFELASAWLLERMRGAL